jgi:hypothetical protein
MGHRDYFSTGRPFDLLFCNICNAFSNDKDGKRTRMGGDFTNDAVRRYERLASSGALLSPTNIFSDQTSSCRIGLGSEASLRLRAGLMNASCT